MRHQRPAAFVVASALAISLATPALAYESTIDTTYATAGTATLANAFYSAMAPLGTGIVVVANRFSKRAGPEQVVRALDGNGQPVPAFGGEGTVTLTLPGEPLAQVVTTTPSGKVVLAGQGAHGIVVARLTAAGALDRSFSANGYTRIGASMDGPTALALDSQGRIVLLGLHDQSTRRHLRFDTLVFRINPRGGLDTGFGAGGVKTFDLAPDEFSDALTVDAKDRPVFTGGRIEKSDKTYVVRLTAAKGHLDDSFGTAGITRVGFGATTSSFGSAIGVSNGSITVGNVVLAATTTSDPLAAFRLTPTGQLDPTFGTAGKALYPAPPKTSLFGRYVDAQGAVIAVGQRRTGQQTYVPVIGALTPAGQVDAGIDPTGIADVPVGGSSASVDDTVVVSGQIVVSISDNVTSPQSSGSVFVTRLGTPGP